MKIGQMVLKGVNCVHNRKIRQYGIENSQLGAQWQKLDQMVLKGIIRVHNEEIRSYGLERSQLSTH